MASHQRRLTTKCNLRLPFEVTQYRSHATNFAAHHNLIFAQDENAQYWEYSYGDEPQHHLIHRYSDRTGRGQNIRYDGTSPDARAIREWADDGSFDTQLIYDKRIRKVTVINALGAATEHYYDIYGFTYRSVYANGLSEWFQRDTRKNVIQHTTTNGNSIQYRYDAHDNLVETTNADGGTTRFQYNAEHQLIAVQDPEGGIWKRDYDAAGNLSEQTDPLGNVTTYEYNKDKLPTVITDAKGGKKQLTYNALGQMSSFTDCSGKTSTWTYDKQGRLLKQANAAGETTQYAYSLEGPERGQLKTITHADGQIETLTHDAEGRLLSHIDPTGKRTSYDYTLAGQVKQRTDAAGNRIGYEWDKAGRLTNLINANQAKYQFQYNNVGQLIAEQAFDGSQTQYQYDATTGMLKQVSDASLITAVAFDNAGRVAAWYANQAGRDLCLRSQWPAHPSHQPQQHPQLVLQPGRSTHSRTPTLQTAQRRIHRHLATRIRRAGQPQRDHAPRRHAHRMAHLRQWPCAWFVAQRH